MISKIIYKNQSKNIFRKNVNNYNINFIRALHFNNNNIIFNLTSINYYFSYTFNQVELEYCFFFSDQENNLIFPSDLSLYYNMHVFCILKSGNIHLKSLSNIHQNKFFCCLEYYKLNIPIKFEVNICKNSAKCASIKLFDNYKFDYNHVKFLNNTKFNCSYINERFVLLTQKVYNQNKIDLLAKSYISHPICSSKEKTIAKKLRASLDSKIPE